MTEYRPRAEAIFEVARDLHAALSYVAVRGTIADKMLLIDLTVETLNKTLYCFAISPTMLDAIDLQLNERYRALQPQPRAINRLFFRCLRLVRAFEREAARWRQRYAVEGKDDAKVSQEAGGDRRRPVDQER